VDRSASVLRPTDPNILFALTGSLGVSFGSDASGIAARPTDGGAHCAALDKAWLHHSATRPEDRM